MGQNIGLVSAIRSQPHDALQVAEASRERRSVGTAGSVEASVGFPAADLGGDGKTGVGGSDRSSCLGGRKIRRVLLNAGHQDVPAAGTMTSILHRHGLIDEANSSKHKAWMRFAHERPNDLWQMNLIRLSTSTVIERKSLL